jgi:hypothetical protein
MNRRSRFCVSYFSVRVHVRFAVPVQADLKVRLYGRRSAAEYRRSTVGKIRLANLNTNGEPPESRSVNDRSLLNTREL